MYFSHAFLSSSLCLLALYVSRMEWNKITEKYETRRHIRATHRRGEKQPKPSKSELCVRGAYFYSHRTHSPHTRTHTHTSMLAADQVRGEESERKMSSWAAIQSHTCICYIELCAVHANTVDFYLFLFHLLFQLLFSIFLLLFCFHTQIHCH